MDVTIYHNPRCSKSRATLQILQEKGVEPTVVEYLTTPPDEKTLRNILKMLGLSPRELMRKKEAKEAGLDDGSLSDDQLIAGMLAHPNVIERPIVLNNGQAKIGRPPEGVLDIL